MRQLAELNIAVPRYPLEDPRIAPFMNALDAVNAAAERAEGFVWRLKGEGNDATDLAFPGLKSAIVNLSVWRDAPSLSRFVFHTVHERFYRRRAEWFDLVDRPHFVMWCVPEGHRPGIAEAAARLDRLEADGPTDAAFGWAEIADVATPLRRCA